MILNQSWIKNMVIKQGREYEDLVQNIIENNVNGNLWVSNKSQNIDIPGKMADNMRMIRRQLPQLAFQYQPPRTRPRKKNGAGMPTNILENRNRNVTINTTFLHVPQMDQTMLTKFTKIMEGCWNISETGYNMWDILNNQVLANTWTTEALIYSCKEFLAKKVNTTIEVTSLWIITIICELRMVLERKTRWEEW